MDKRAERRLLKIAKEAEEALLHFVSSDGQPGPAGYLAAIRIQLVKLFPELDDLDSEGVTTAVCAVLRDFAKDKGWSEVRRQELAELLRMRRQQNAIALFFREHYATEISEGRHNGLSLDALVTHYLDIERRIPFWMRRWTGR